MPVTINGSTGLTFPDNATQSTSPKTGFVNRIINGNFGINQRDVSGTVTLATGIYGHDRWKAGASGCTYTFATVANTTTLTITAGSLIQVIEGINLQSGTFTLSFTGTAQGKIGAGSFGASGITGAAVGGTNLNIEINTGTVSLVQFELGSTATPFEFRSIGQEFALCQRYFQLLGQGFTGCAEGTTAVSINEKFQVQMRSAPTTAIVSGQSCSIRISGGDAIAASPTLAAPTSTINALWTLVDGFSGLTSNSPIQARNLTAASLFIAITSEL